MFIRCANCEEALEVSKEFLVVEPAICCMHCNKTMDISSVKSLEALDVVNGEDKVEDTLLHGEVFTDLDGIEYEF